MLRNHEFALIESVLTSLTIIKQHAIDNDDFYNATGLTIADINKQITELKTMHATRTHERVRANARSNAYNKAHPELHRRLQKAYVERHKHGGNDRVKKYQSEYYLRVTKPARQARAKAKKEQKMCHTVDL